MCIIFTCLSSMIKLIVINKKIKTFRKKVYEGVVLCAKEMKTFLSFMNLCAYCD